MLKIDTVSIRIRRVPSRGYSYGRAPVPGPKVGPRWAQGGPQVGPRWAQARAQAQAQARAQAWAQAPAQARAQACPGSHASNANRHRVYFEHLIFTLDTFIVSCRRGANNV